MLKVIKNLFKKENKVTSSITIYTEESGEMFVDLRVKDYSEQSINHISSLMTMFDQPSFFQVSSILRDQCESSDKEDFYGKVIESIILKTGSEKFVKEPDTDQDSLCVDPTDML